MQEEIRLAAAGRPAADVRFSVHADPRLNAPFYPSERKEPQRSAFPELDCVRGRLSTAVITQAESRAAALGVGADRVLVAAGAINEEAYCRALSTSCGLQFETLEGIARSTCPLTDDQLIEAVAAEMLPRCGRDTP